MKIPDFVIKDIEAIRIKLEPFIDYYGIFGSLLSKDINEVNDVDVLWVYSGITFEQIRDELQDMTLSLPHLCSYRNYGVWLPEPPGNGQYYDFIFMPKEKPDREFMIFHDGKIHYFSESFETWRKTTVSINSI